MPRSARLRLVAGAAALAALALSACAGSESNPVIDPAPTGPSTASIQRSYLAMSTALVTAVNTGTSKINSKKTGPGTALLTPAVTVTVPVFQQFESRSACSGGGYVSATVTMSGSLTASETSVFGSLGWSGGESMVGCSDGTWTTNSNPTLTMSGTLNINNSRLSMNIAMGGGWSMTSPGNAAASCGLSGVLMQWDTITGWSNSGVIICNPGGTFHI